MGILSTLEAVVLMALTNMLLVLLFSPLSAGTIELGAVLMILRISCLLQKFC
jgi:hypothetical protein